MGKKILSIIIIMAVILGALPVSTEAAETDTGNMVTFDKIGTSYNETYYIFANGCPLILKQGTNGADYTVIYVDNDGDGEVTDSDIWAPEGKNKTAAGNKYNHCYIYGGGDSGELDGNTSITMLGGRVDAVYGGSYSATVKGDTKVIINGGTVSSVYGAGQKAESNVTGNTEVIMDGGSVGNSVFGGGYDGKVGGNTHVAVGGGTVGSHICGGSSGNSGSSDDTGAIGGSTNVTFGGTAETYNIMGGSFYCGTITGNAELSITGGTVTNYVYGSGYEAKVMGNASVNMTGGIVNKRVYGTSYRQSAAVGGDVSVTVTNGTVEGYILAKGDADVTGTVSLTAGKSAKIGTAGSTMYNGIIFNGGTEKRGIDSFQAVPGLADDAKIYLYLPAGYVCTGKPVVATDGVEDDISYMELTGGASVPDGMGLHLDGTDIYIGYPKVSGTDAATVTIDGKTTTYSYAEGEEYTTAAKALEAAWNYAEANGTDASPATLKLLVNVTLSNPLTLDNDESKVIFTMDDNVTLTSSASNGIIQVKNGTLAIGSGSIISTFNEGFGVSMHGGHLLLEEGAFISGENLIYGVYIYNGEFTMNGGKIAASVSVKNACYGICAQYGTVEMNGGEITAYSLNTRYCHGIYMHYGTVKMNGGKITTSNNSKFQGYGVYMNTSAQTFTMKGGTINAGRGVLVIGGKADITGGTIIGTDTYAAINVQNSTITIGGTTVIEGSQNAVTVNGSTEVTITGNAQLTGSVSVSNGQDSHVTISGNTKITATHGISIWGNGSPTVEVTSGTICGKQYGVKVETGSLAISGGDISADSYAVCVSGSGNATISGGTAKGNNFGLLVWNDSTGNITLSGGTFTSSIYSVNSRNAVEDLLAKDCAYFKDTTVSEETRISDASILAKNNLAVSDGYGTVTVAQVPLAITGQPQDQSWTYGDTQDHVLTVKAEKPGDVAGDIVYQWYKGDKSSGTEGTEISGATSTSYTLSDSLGAGNYTYYCVVTCGSYIVTSNTTTVNVSQREVTASITGTVSKEYDRTTNVSNFISILLEGVLDNDDVTAQADSYTYDSPDAGDRTITVSGITLVGNSADNYKLSNASAATAGTIKPLDISNAIVNFDGTSGLVYDSTQKKIQVSDITVNDSNFQLVENTDYTLLGNTAANAGTYTCKITGKGNFTGEITRDWTIQKRAITVTPDSNQGKEYGTSDPAALACTITSGQLAGNDTLSDVLSRKEGEDVGIYEITKNSKAGTSNPDYDITVTKGVNFEIRPSSLEDSSVAVTLSETSYTYDGTAKEPVVTVEKNGRTLTEGTDYTVEYADNTNAGLATVTISAVGNGNYSGTASRKFTIKQVVTEIYTAPEVADRVYSPSASLKDSELAGGTASVQGTWSWQSADIIPAVDNNGYVAVFTPVDSKNYETVTRTIPVTVTKAVPYIAASPAAVSITYGDTLHASALSGWIVQYGNGAGQAGSGADSTEVVAGAFTWKDASIMPVVADSGVTEYTVVFTPSDSANYSAAETRITIIVNKAEKPRNTPSDMNVSYQCTTVGDVPLPDGWEWQESDKSTALETDQPVKAAAVYNGPDKENYRDVIVMVTITRAACSHASTEIRNAVAASDTKEGYSGDIYCTECKVLLTAGYVLPKTGNSGDSSGGSSGNGTGGSSSGGSSGGGTGGSSSGGSSGGGTGGSSGGYIPNVTQAPSPSANPSTVPTAEPSMMPTAEPSIAPTAGPATVPTAEPAQTPDTSTIPDASALPTQEPVPGSMTPAPSNKPSDKTAEADSALKLNAGFKATQTGSKIKVSWGKVPGADGYDVYVQYCGRKFPLSPSSSVKGSKVKKTKVKKINGKKLDLKKSYKLYVAAYKLVDGKKIILCKSIIAHNAGIKNKKYTNVKDIKVKKDSYNLKKGETVKISVHTVLVDKDKKMLSGNHAKEFRYATSDKKVATVSSSGRIKAAGKGSCTIYVYAKNGNAKKIKVKVK